MPSPVTGPVRGGPGGTLHIEFRPPLEFIRRQAGAFGRELQDLRPLWNRFKPIMSEIERAQFDTAGHGEWTPLAQSTLEAKARHGYPPDPLIRTRSLYDSLVDPNRAAEIGPRQMAWVSDVAYAGFHQEGGDDLPQREVIAIDTEDRRKFEREMIDWINDAQRKTWGRI